MKPLFEPKLYDGFKQSSQVYTGCMKSRINTGQNAALEVALMKETVSPSPTQILRFLVASGNNSSAWLSSLWVGSLDEFNVLYLYN